MKNFIILFVSCLLVSCVIPNRAKAQLLPLTPPLASIIIDDNCECPNTPCHYRFEVTVCAGPECSNPCKTKIIKDNTTDPIFVIYDFDPCHPDPYNSALFVCVFKIDNLGNIVCSYCDCYHYYDGVEINIPIND